MEIIVKTSEMKKVLDKIGNILPVKPPLLITNGILIEAKEDGVSCISTDLENTIKINIACTIIEKGNVVIPGKKFISLIKQIPDEEIKITKIDNSIEIKCHSSKYSFIVMDYDEFPKFPKFTGDVIFQIEGSNFKKAIGKVKFCIDEGESRPHFRGGLIDLKEDYINIVATDTKRMVVFKINSDKKHLRPYRCLLPYKLLTILPTLIDDSIIDVSIGKNQISFKYQDTYLVGQLLAGCEDFPNYEKVIPDETKQKAVIIPRDTILSTLKRLSLFTSERYNKVKISFVKNIASFSVVSPEVGEAQEKIDIEYIDIEQDLAFPPTFLIEFLQLVEGEKIRLGFINGKNPVLIRDSQQQDYLYVAMPLKIE